MHRFSVQGARFFLIASVLLLVMVGGCDQMTPPPSKVRFNDNIARSTRSIAKQASLLRTKLDGLGGTQPFDIADVEAAYGRLGDAIKRAQREAEEMRLPRNATPSAEALLAKYKAFLKDQERIYNENIARIMKIARDKAGDPKKRHQTIVTEIQSVLTEEDKTLSPLLAAQVELAKEMNFTLVSRKT
jgi:hypothetical protein